MKPRSSMALPGQSTAGSPLETAWSWPSCCWTITPTLRQAQGRLGQRLQSTWTPHHRATGHEDAAGAGEGAVSAGDPEGVGLERAAREPLLRKQHCCIVGADLRSLSQKSLLPSWEKVRMRGFRRKSAAHLLEMTVHGQRGDHPHLNPLPSKGEERDQRPLWQLCDGICVSALAGQTSEVRCRHRDRGRTPTRSRGAPTRHRNAGHEDAAGPGAGAVAAEDPDGVGAWSRTKRG